MYLSAPLKVPLPQCRSLGHRDAHMSIHCTTLLLYICTEQAETLAYLLYDGKLIRLRPWLQRAPETGFTLNSEVLYHLSKCKQNLST